MENFGGTGFSDLSKAMRKKRSNRPRSNAQLVRDIDNSPLSSLPLSDNGSKASSDDNTGNFTNYQRKELSLNQCNSNASLTNIGEAELTLKVSDEDGGFEGVSEVGIEGINENKGSVVGMGNENNKLKRFKLKLGGVTRTLHPPVGDSSQSDATLPRQKLILQEDSDEAVSPNPNKRSNLRGVPWKDFSRSGFIGQKSSSSRGKISDENVRKSKRVPKRKLLDGAVSDEDDGDEDDEEIRFLEKLKKPRLVADYGAEEDDESGTTKHRRISRVLNRTRDGGDAGDYRSLTSIKEIKKSMSARVSDDNDYIEDDDDDPMSDVDMENKRKKQRKEFADMEVTSSKEMAVTTRQRAHLQTVKDPLSGSGSSLIEFQKGLPPAPTKKQKEKLTDVEQQLKKAEAAQRRRMQVEKAARESEAEAIRKILGQDSSRKKREDKIKKRQEELAQERSNNIMTLAANTVRWNMGPTGTVVTFPNDMGLPSILEPKPCCYPPPREKCAGPSCKNPYKYRDSKSRLPLCSLRCYKAIHEKMPPLSAC